MAGGVVQCFLGDPVAGSLNVCLDRRQSIGDVTAHDETGRDREGFAMTLERTSEAQLRQRRRRQCACRAAHLVDRLVNMLHDSVDRGGFAHLVFERDEVQAGRGQRLAGTVVQLAGDPASVFFLKSKGTLGHDGFDASFGGGDRADGYHIEQYAE